MTIQEIQNAARVKLSPKCRVCKSCDGVACKGEIPGAGAAGDGSSWTRCVEYLRKVKLNMDTIYENHGQDTTLKMFGKAFKYPLFIAPIGGMLVNYGGKVTDREYMTAAIEGAKRSGIIAFTGDGASPEVFETSMELIKTLNGNAVSILKPWGNEKIIERLPSIKDSGCIAYGMDIDAAGFSNLGSQGNNASPKSVEALRMITGSSEIPFILKGVMTAAGAKKAVEAGAYAIVVSTHGGRVIPSAPSTCEVLPEIRAAVGGKIKIIVDGGIRTGADIFKALALGADAVMIGRPYVTAACGGGADGVALYTELLGAQLKNIMLMCGAANLAEITSEKIMTQGSVL